MQDIIARSLGAKLNGDIEQINKKIEGLSKIFTFKGTKERVEDLPKEGNKPGDMWSVKGREYVWTLNDETGEYEWVDIGDIVDLDAFIMKTDIEQTIGDNENKVMSQKAIKDTFELYYNAEEVDELIETLDEKKADLDYVNSKGHYLGLWNAINGTCDTGLEVGTEYVPGDEFVIGEASAPKNMIVNGDFSVSSTAVPALFGWNVTAWNALRSKQIEGGVAYVQNGTDDNKTIKQTVNNLIIGETYWLTAKLLKVEDKALKILLDDNGAKPIVNVPISDEVQTFSVGIVATSTSHTITFSGPNAKYALTDVVLKSQVVPNYRPFGDTYTGVQKVEMESVNVEVNDSYLYDGTNWRLLKNVNEKIDVDADLNPNSTNPVQNRVVTAAIQGIEEEIDGFTKDLKGEVLKIYFDPTASQSGTGLSPNSPFKTSTEVWNLVNEYNGEFIISGSNTSIQNPLFFAQALSNKIVKFESLYVKINDFCHISNCDIMIGYQSTLFRDAEDYRIGCTGNCGIYVNYQATISDTAAAVSDYYYMFVGEIQNSPSLPCNIIFTTNAPNCIINSNSRALISNYGEGNTVCNLHDNLNGSIKALCEAGANIPCTINIGGNPSITKDSWTTNDKYAVINYAGEKSDLNGKEIAIYVDPVSGNDNNTGLSSSSKIKTWSKLVELINRYYNGAIRVWISGGYLTTNQDASFYDKIIRFEGVGYGLIVNHQIALYGCSISIGSSATLKRGSRSGKLYFNGEPSNFHMGYQSEIASDVGCTDYNYNGVFIAFDSTCHISFYSPRFYITNGSGGPYADYAVFGSYNASVNIYMGSGVNPIVNLSNALLYVEDSYSAPCSIIFSGELEDAKVKHWAMNDSGKVSKNCKIEYLNRDLKGETANVYIDSNLTDDADRNDGLTSDTAVKSWWKLLEILQTYKNGKVIVNITGTLDMNIIDQNVQLDNVDLEFVGNIKTSEKTYFTNVNITYHNGDWVSSSITYLINCSFTAYTCTLDDDNLSGNQPRFTVAGSRIYLGQDTGWCTLASTNSFGLFYCNGLSSEFYLQRVDGTINYLCDYTGSTSINYGPVVYVYIDDITKTGYINGGDSSGIIIYRGTHIPLPQVTSADNGKVLQVINGQWTAVSLDTWQGGSY